MKRFSYALGALAVAGALASPGFAQNFTSAAEVRPILEATRSQWVSVREYEGQDQLSFGHLMAWRCGIDEIRYGVNGGAEQRLDAEQCYEGEAVPDAQKTPERAILTFPQGSVTAVSVTIVYDDGSTDSQSYARANILSH